MDTLIKNTNNNLIIKIQSFYRNYYLKNLVVKIQSLYRGFNIRKLNQKLNDSMTFSLLDKCIDIYSENIKSEHNINQCLKEKKIRISNFPSHVKYCDVLGFFFLQRKIVAI